MKKSKVILEIEGNGITALNLKKTLSIIQKEISTIRDDVLFDFTIKINERSEEMERRKQ